MAELEAIIANLEKEITKLKKLNARFESELLALNPNIDIIAIRKAVLSTLSASEDDDSVRCLCCHNLPTAKAFQYRLRELQANSQWEAHHLPQQDQTVK